MVLLGSDENAGRLDALRTQLTAGWRIDAPIFARSAFISAAGQVRALEFMLCGDSGRHVMTLPDGPSIRAFLHHYGLNVIEL